MRGTEITLTDISLIEPTVRAMGRHPECSVSPTDTAMHATAMYRCFGAVTLYMTSDGEVCYSRLSPGLPRLVMKYILEVSDIVIPAGRITIEGKEYRADEVRRLLEGLEL